MSCLGSYLNIIDFRVSRELFFFTFTNYFENAVTLEQSHKKQKTIQIQKAETQSFPVIYVADRFFILQVFFISHIFQLARKRTTIVRLGD